MTNLTEVSKSEIVRSVYTTTSSPNLSKKYTHINTSRVISDMEKLGWIVTETKEVKTRSEKKKGFQKHIIKFYNPNIIIKDSNGDDACPQILIINSHDGSTKFQFRVGIYRFICYNGMVIADSEFENLTIRHMGYSFEELQNLINVVLEKLPNVVKKIERFKSCTMTDDQMKEFALKAAVIRFGDKYKIDTNELLTSTRNEDNGNSVWTVFNRIQEKLTNGGYTTISNGEKPKYRMARGIKSFSKDLKMNENLWELADTYTCE